MEQAAAVIVAGAQGQEVLAGFGAQFAEQLDFDVPDCGVQSHGLQQVLKLAMIIIYGKTHHCCCYNDYNRKSVATITKIAKV